MTELELLAIADELKKSCNKVAYSVTEAAEAIGVSAPTLYNLIHTEGFPSYKVGGKVFIDAQGLREWSARNAAERAGCR